MADIEMAESAPPLDPKEVFVTANPIAVPEAFMKIIINNWNDQTKTFSSAEPIKIDEKNKIYFGSHAAVYRFKDDPTKVVRVEPNTGEWENNIVKIPHGFLKFFIVPEKYSSEQTYHNGHIKVGYRTQLMEYGGVDVIEMLERKQKERKQTDIVRLRTDLFEFLSEFVSYSNATNYKVLSFDVKMDNIVCRVTKDGKYIFKHIDIDTWILRDGGRFTGNPAYISTYHPVKATFGQLQYQILRDGLRRKSVGLAFLVAKYIMVSCCLMIMIDMLGENSKPTQSLGEWPRLNHLKAVVDKHPDQYKNAVATEWLRLSDLIKKENKEDPDVLQANCFAPFTDTVLRV